MKLFIARHAWAENQDAIRWPGDAARPLTPAGTERWRRLVERLHDGGCQPAAIVTSPLVRCRQTATLWSERLKHTSVFVAEPLAPGCTTTTLLAALRAFESNLPADQDIACVGHAPDVGLWVADLIGDRGAAIDMVKGAVAAVEFDERPVIGLGRLRWLATAKLFGL